MLKPLLFITAALFLTACNRLPFQNQSTTPEEQFEENLDAATGETGETGQTQTGQPSPSPAASANPGDTTATLPLEPQNNSGQSGTVAITAAPDNTIKVILALQGGNFTQPQPAHIHVGTCDKPGAVVFPLTPVINGRSETTINADINQVRASGQALILNVHESEEKIQNYTACATLQ